jgi:phospholipid transport system substrate-binding protein
MEKQLTKKLLIPKIINQTLFAAILVALSNQGAFAGDTDDVRKLLQGKFDYMTTTLDNKDLDEEAKKEKIEDLIRPIFDFPLMSKLSLGRTSWTAMTKEDQEEFVELFTKLFKQTYLDKILDYVDEDVKFDECNKDGKKIYISTFIVGEDKKIPVLYKFYQSGAGWKIFDIEIEGVSYIQTYRSQFSESLKEITIKELMVKMEKIILSQ